MRAAPFALLITLIPMIGASAQTHVQGTQTPLPIESLTVQGNHVYSAAQILTVAGLRIGTRAAPADFEAARLRLLASGAFQRAGYRYAPGRDGKGYRVTIEVNEETQMYPIAFEDLPATDAKLRAWLQQKDALFGPRIPATQPFLDRYAALIGDYVKPLGFSGTIKTLLTPEFSTDLTILFRPSTPRRTVAEVHFTNTGDIPWQTLQNAIASTAVGAGYTDARFRQWLDASVRPLYEAHGHLRVSFPSILTEPAKEVKGLVVNVRVDQGPLYVLADAKADGAANLSRVLKPLKVGETANFDQVRSVQNDIEDSLQRKGYLHVKSHVSRTIDDAKHTVSVVIHADPGPQYLTGKLDIRGLDVISEPVIRKLWGLPEGKPFNARYPDHFLDVIREEGIFDNLGKMHVETKVQEDAKIVDVTLYFEGARTKKKDTLNP